MRHEIVRARRGAKRNRCEQAARATPEISHVAQREDGGRLDRGMRQFARPHF
jgi:hypothetical protein